MNKASAITASILTGLTSALIAWRCLRGKHKAHNGFCHVCGQSTEKVKWERFMRGAVK